MNKRIKQQLIDWCNKKHKFNSEYIEYKKCIFKEQKCTLKNVKSCVSVDFTKEESEQKVHSAYLVQILVDDEKSYKGKAEMTLLIVEVAGVTTSIYVGESIHFSSNKSKVTAILHSLNNRLKKF